MSAVAVAHEAAEVLGSQVPRLVHLPDGLELDNLGVPAAEFGDVGIRAVKLAALAGLHLDPWQQYVLVRSLARRPGDGLWLAEEVDVVVPRQNGKNGILEARQLAGLFILHERLQIHTAHLGDTADEAFLRLRTLIEGTPALFKRVAKNGFVKTNGKSGIVLLDGCRIRFKTRTKGGGRGFSCDCLYLDEAMELPDEDYNAIMFALSARPNAQHWLTASAPDELTHKNAIVLARARRDALAGTRPRQFYCEWSVDENALRANPALADDPALWAQSNPGKGIRIRHETILGERGRMTARGFEVERLNAGYWPDPDDSAGQVIPIADVIACRDPGSRIEGNRVFAVQVSLDRKHVAIAAAGWRSDGLAHTEVVAHRPGAGTAWLVERVAKLFEKWDTACGLVIDLKGPAGALAPDLIAAGVELVEMKAQDHADACGAFYDAFTGGDPDEADEELAEITGEDGRERTIRHLGQPEFEQGLKVVTVRPLGNAWAWDARVSGLDITPVSSSSLAYGALRTKVPERGYYDEHDFVVLPD